MSSSLEVEVTRSDVISDPENLMPIWVRQNLSKRKRSKIEGCAMAIEEFGNHNPFSNGKIYHMKSMQEFKDTRKIPAAKKGAKKHWNGHKKDSDKKFTKLKSKLREIANESENDSQAFSETIHSLLKEF